MQNSNVSKNTILVVEDDNDLLLLMKVALRNKFEAVLKSEAIEAWEYLQTAEELPRAVLLDLNLASGMSSEELLVKIRADKRTENLKVILVSGWDDLEKRCQELNADGWLKKPFDLSQLLETVESL